MWFLLICAAFFSGFAGWDSLHHNQNHLIEQNHVIKQKIVQLAYENREMKKQKSLEEKKIHVLDGVEIKNLQQEIRG